MAAANVHQPIFTTTSPSETLLLSETTTSRIKNWLHFPPLNSHFTLQAELLLLGSLSTCASTVKCSEPNCPHLNANTHTQNMTTTKLIVTPCLCLSPQCASVCWCSAADPTTPSTSRSSASPSSDWTCRTWTRASGAPGRTQSSKSLAHTDRGG